MKKGCDATSASIEYAGSFWLGLMGLMGCGPAGIKPSNEVYGLDRSAFSDFRAATSLERSYIYRRLDIGVLVWLPLGVGGR